MFKRAVIDWKFSVLLTTAEKKKWGILFRGITKHKLRKTEWIHHLNEFKDANKPQLKAIKQIFHCKNSRKDYLRMSIFTRHHGTKNSHRGGFRHA